MPDLFEPVEPETAQLVLSEWLDQNGPLEPHQVEGDLPFVRALIDAADERLLLPKLGDQPHHESGWVLHSGFLEVVLATDSRMLDSRSC